MTLKKGETKKNIKNILINISNKAKPKGVDVYKYVGTICLKKDALEIQNELRNEW